MLSPLATLSAISPVQSYISITVKTVIGSKASHRNYIFVSDTAWKDVQV